MKIQINNRTQFVLCILAFLLSATSIFMKNYNTNIAMIMCTVAVLLNFFWTIEDKMWVIGLILGGFLSGAMWFIYETMYYPKDNLWYPIVGVWVAVTISFLVTIFILSNFIQIVKKNELKVS